MRGASAIVGVGSTAFGTFADRTSIGLASDAVAAALADAGLERRDIDGLIVHIGSPRGDDYDLAASLLGLEVRFSAQPWSHGRFAASVVQHAAMAVGCGLADHVLCLAAYNNTRFGRHGSKTRPNYQELLRPGGGPHAETPHAGFTAPVAGAAMATQRYFHKYGIGADSLAAVALGFRRHARLNPLAVMREKPMSRDDYLAARPIVEPLRLLDCSMPVDGAVAMIVTSAARARDCRRPPAYLLGMQGIHAGPDEFIFGQPGLGINQASVFDYQPLGADQLVYRMAGVDPADIGHLHVYDAFSPQVLWTLERFGFCRPGEAADWIQDGRIELGGALPINSSGGHLSEGHFNGWGQMAEIVRQLRGEAGARQVARPALGMWATTIGDAIIFGREGGRPS